MAMTKHAFVGKSESIEHECTLDCANCRITPVIVSWLTSLYTLHPDTQVIDYRFTTNHDARDNIGCCVHMVAQVEWKE